MLERLLRLMAGAEGSLPTAHLAQSLGVSETMLCTLIDELVRLGYVESAEGACAQGACAHCPVASRCGGTPGVRMWRLTDRGKAAARQ